MNDDPVGFCRLGRIHRGGLPGDKMSCRLSCRLGYSSTWGELSVNSGVTGTNKMGKKRDELWRSLHLLIFTSFPFKRTKVPRTYLLVKWNVLALSSVISKHTNYRCGSWAEVDPQVDNLYLMCSQKILLQRMCSGFLAEEPTRICVYILLLKKNKKMWEGCEVGGEIHFSYCKLGFITITSMWGLLLLSGNNCFVMSSKHYEINIWMV